MRGLGEIYEDGYLITGLPGQGNSSYCSTVNAAHLNVGSFSQTRYIVELGLQLVCGAKQVLLAPDNEDPGAQNRQCHNDECS